MDDDMLLLLDFEKIVAGINPETTLNKEQLRELGERERSDKKILIAEDSGLLRALLQETLSEAGYHQTVVFEDGKEVYDHLLALVEQGKKVEDEYQLLITDIEMPRMDGHHLTRLLKENGALEHLPVIIFSSLITSELRHKGEVVGADGQVSKPETVELIKLIDHHIL